MEGYIEANFASTQRQLGDSDDSRAMLAVSAMVGALALSRVITDPARSDALLRSVREQLVAFGEPKGPLPAGERDDT